ncbi:MAG: fumarylacetoacetate hydrolase family protein [Alphaproteobacteria bacterium]
MKLLRFGTPDNEKPGILDANNTIRDLSSAIDDISANSLSDHQLNQIRNLNPLSLPAVTTSPRIAPCIAHIGKIICIGLNYKDHAIEVGIPLPEEPIIFAKATSAVSGPYDTVEIPRNSTKTDWEVELGVVIGKHTKYISPNHATQHIAGYCIVNDLSERDFQLQRSGQWTKGKSCDTFAPIGPWLVTRDEVPNPQNLAMYLKVNQKIYQNGSTKTMHFNVNTIISHLSQFMSLQPGDLISTGTPPGVGMGQSPPTYLAPGDVMELGIEGLGVQTQNVIAAP